MSAGPKIVTAEAEHLLRIARDVRAAGDVPLVRLSIECVSDTDMTLADELEFIALALLRALDAKEREVAEMTLHAELFASDVAQLQAKLDAVKSAHPMVSDAGQREHCGACIKPWPCLTIQALDAD